MADFVLTDEYRDCRDFGHAWAFSSNGWKGSLSVVADSRGSLVRRELRCIRCDTHRFDFVSRGSGETLRRNYRHPKGYLNRGHGHVSKQYVRRLAIRAALRAMKG